MSDTPRPAAPAPSVPPAEPDASVARFRALLEGSFTAMLLTLPDGRVLAANRAACELFGMTEAEVQAVGWDGLMVEDEALAAALAERESSGRSQAVLRYRRKDGTTSTAEVACHSPADASGWTLQVITLRDISELLRSARELRQRASQQERLASVAAAMPGMVGSLEVAPDGGEEALRRSRAELRALAAQLQAAREQEMGRIARDLHDDLGQALTGLQLDLRWLEQRLEELPADDRTGPILDRLVAASELAQATLHTVQRIARDLRPASLDQLGLAGAIRQEARRFTQRTGLAVEHRLEVEQGPAAPVATALYRIFQEALTNVARHARASRVSVRLREEGGALLLEVEDDGQGLPAGEGRRWGALGVLGMEERAASLGGWLRLGRGTLGGTLVVARIPVSTEGGAQ